MSIEYIKTHSAAKKILPAGEELHKKIADTTTTAKLVVGGTLGPGGGPVAIERQEYNIPPLLTKDGVTVFKALGFEDPFQQAILELLRDASVRTANEAGDGTTTATILAEGFYRFTRKYCRENPSVPPIRVIKQIEDTLRNKMLPLIENLTIPCDFNTQEGRGLLLNVAKLSANGDLELAEAVLKCFDICGHEGNVTIVEANGKPGIEVEKIEGYPIPSGYEESCSRYYPSFITDQGTQRIVYDKPIFILYFGRITDIQTCLPILEKIQDGFRSEYLKAFNVVFMATGFSDSVLATFSQITQTADNFNICPLVAPQTAVVNSQKHFLDDIAAVVDGLVFDPTTHPLSEMQLEHLGNIKKVVGGTDVIYETKGVKTFESGRYRSSVVGYADEAVLLERLDEVKTGLSTSESEYDRRYIQERVAKLSDGIAKLKVIGASNGELKERRDRAEDAVCAVRGAIKHGCLIGGGWTIRRICHELRIENTEISNEIIIPALQSVIDTLYQNAGVVWDELPESSKTALESSVTGDPSQAMVLDLSVLEIVPALTAGVLDSTPALTEALKNSVSIATRLGTLKGCVVFPRSHEADHAEARDAKEFERGINYQGSE